MKTTPFFLVIGLVLCAMPIEAMAESRATPYIKDYSAKDNMALALPSNLYARASGYRCDEWKNINIAYTKKIATMKIKMLFKYTALVGFVLLILCITFAYAAES